SDKPNAAMDDMDLDGQDVEELRQKLIELALIEQDITKLNDLLTADESYVKQQAKQQKSKLNLGDKVEGRQPNVPIVTNVQPLP
ncbi:MAG TPA: hypothetical protein PLD88_08920, partial [Candidatus Berkiella sp.]|nr:hypothetical protein [Candidatus Berkiella sp.]